MITKIKRQIYNIKKPLSIPVRNLRNNGQIKPQMRFL